MPLSEHEQRLLDEMERNLYGNNSDVHAAARRGRPHYRSLTLGILTAVVGLVLLVVAVMTQLIILGLGGFVVMFVGVLWATRADRRSVETKEAGSASTKRSRPGFMERMEERWDRDGDNRL